jgi:hypothetical protein
MLPFTEAEFMKILTLTHENPFERHVSLIWLNPATAVEGQNDILQDR